MKTLSVRPCYIQLSLDKEADMMALDNLLRLNDSLSTHKFLVSMTSLFQLGPAVDQTTVKAGDREGMRRGFAICSRCSYLHPDYVMLETC